MAMDKINNACYFVAFLFYWKRGMFTDQPIKPVHEHASSQYVRTLRARAWGDRGLAVLDNNTVSGGGDIFLVKYNSSGSKQWTKQVGSTTGNHLGDYGKGVTVDSSNNVYIAGETLGGFDENTNAGSSDMFLLKFNSDGVKQ